DHQRHAAAGGEDAQCVLAGDDGIGCAGQGRGPAVRIQVSLQTSQQRWHLHGHHQARSARAGAVRLRQLATVTATPATHGTNHAQPTAGARPTWPEVSGTVSRTRARTTARRATPSPRTGPTAVVDAATTGSRPSRARPDLRAGPA